MNQRSRNRRRNPLVLIGQLIKRRNGCRIAQHNGNLTTTGDAFGLALGAGLGLHSVHQGRREDFATMRGKHCAGPRFTDVERAAIWADVAPARCCLFDSARDDSSGKSGRVELGANVHGLLQSGVIPPMDESYTVTSDVSTTILQAVA
jgi:hypothetical protein